MTYEELCTEFAKIDSFMEPQITQSLFFECETSHIIGGDTYMIPHWEYEPGEHILVAEVTGYGARLSAPGYLDCTEWSVFPTEQDAIDELERLYLDGLEE